MYLHKFHPHFHAFQVIFFAAAFVACAGAPLQAREPEAIASHHHRPMSVRHVRENGAADSTNWSGYVVSGPEHSVTSVSGSWKVPEVQCDSNSPSQYASFWVGIDGWTSNTVEQIGVDSDCSSGTPSYYAWFEFYPEPSYYAGNLRNLTPGHVMSARMSFDVRRHEFTATITDLTEPFLTFTTTFKPQRGAAMPARSSAEWVAEAPSGANGILPLANFGTVYMGDDYTSAPLTCDATVNGKTGPAGSFGANLWAATMVNETTSEPMAAPSALTNDGSSFFVTWYSAGP